MSSDYTANYFFEIDSGVATKRRLVTTEEAAVAHHSQIGGGDPEAIRRAFLKDRFDANQRSVFKPAADALGNVTLLKRKSYIVQVTVRDAKTKKGSYGKTNFEFRPGVVYSFPNVNSFGFYMDISTDTV
ncbi:hypothetical protein PR001_g709 [Phytophthora rubi]|uniref:Uncharacterized protein n=1 Tax=Phytophthora rubi TaxID=129364 RepID=A0A6A3PBJ5_9STRA|nr:hypothetical protein PR001_g709 [Phytophthora rubi]